MRSGGGGGGGGGGLVGLGKRMKELCGGERWYIYGGGRRGGEGGEEEGVEGVGRQVR